MPSSSSMLEILGLGPGWIAVDKPAGVSVHNDPEGRSDALALARDLLESDTETSKAAHWEGPKFPPAAVHRLDRETSGVLILATRRDMASRLGQALEKRTTRKIYRAVLRGKLDEESGKWTWPLSDRAEGRQNPAGRAPDRKPCETLFTRKRFNDHLSEVEIDLLTGRQHQIRRHSVLAKHGVVGDRRYGDARHNALIERLFGVGRLMLHAVSMEVNDEGKQLFSVTSPVPVEFERLFEEPTTT